jgi:hypothetical protein
MRSVLSQGETLNHQGHPEHQGHQELALLIRSSLRKRVPRCFLLGRKALERKGNAGFPIALGERIFSVLGVLAPLVFKIYTAPDGFSSAAKRFQFCT